MKKSIISFSLILFSVVIGYSQLSNDLNSGDFSVGFNISRTSIVNSSMDKNDSLRSYKPYFGFGIDMIHHSYERGDWRYFMTMKALTTDLLNVAYRINKKIENENHVDMTGFFWGKLGYNIYANDNFCIGIGGSLADYVVDLPKWKPNFNATHPYYRYEEPSGWHFSAGPSLFVDYAIGGFIINSVSAYNVGFYRHMINEGYEQAVDLIDGYKSPHFFSTALYLNHTNTGLYLSFEYSKMIDNGIVKNKLSRKELAIGWILDLSIF